ncbi:hypothetical protein KUV73_16590 [Mameliella alba]|nr:hypothetical protein [Mameliella alba]MBY6171863.1 hypothetical protein [Mameliella alba]MBY6175991.1 hypothetical protein [Mameliella alba]
MVMTRPLLTSSHWGTYRVSREGPRVTGLHPFERDPDPSVTGPGIVELLELPTRITATAVRGNWLSLTRRPATAASNWATRQSCRPPMTHGWRRSAKPLWALPGPNFAWTIPRRCAPPFRGTSTNGRASWTVSTAQTKTP